MATKPTETIPTGEWIETAQQLPAHHQYVLACYPYSEVRLAYYVAEKANPGDMGVGWYPEGNGVEYIHETPKYWLAFPDPPEYTEPDDGEVTP